MSRRPQHQTRKQLRSELAVLKTPEGLADLLHSKRNDEDFQRALSDRIWELRRKEIEAEDAEAQEADDQTLTNEPDVAAVDPATATAPNQDQVNTSAAPQS